MLNKEHNTLEGIQKIVNIKASLNLGLSEDLKEAFPNTNTVSIKKLENCAASQKNNILFNNLPPE